MEQSLVQMFFVGFAFATVLYFIISGLAWIRVTQGMERDEALAFVKRTNGKTWAEIMMEEGHLEIEEVNAMPKEMMESEPTLMLTTAEMASHMQIIHSITVERSGAEKPYRH